MFYEKLRKYGFRAHHAKQIYAYAQSIVESARGNSGRKLILKKLTARIDKYDYRLDLDTTTLVLKLHDNHEVKLKLLVPRERVEKFKEWSNYELVVKYMVRGSGYQYTSRFGLRGSKEGILSHGDISRELKELLRDTVRELETFRGTMHIR